ncbi:MAG: hypothetical protein QOD99_2831, partial [Chthoniobacter sp.]|nr:hypothetical protein [Chthoniobacter sp.]
MPSLLNRRTVTKVDGQPHGYLFVLLCLVCFSAPSLFGAQTLVKQELFEQIGVLDRDAPGNLGTVWGSFVKRPVGPRAASGAPGWSSEIRGETTLHDMSLQTGAGLAARYSGMFGAWYFMGHVMTDGVNKVQLISLQNTAGGGGNPVATAVVDSEMKISLSFYNSPEQSNVVRLSPNTWYWIGVKWRAYANQGIRYDVTWVSKTLGGSLTVLGTPVKNALMGGDFQRIRAGAVNTGGYAAMIARYGAPSLFHLDNFADGNYPPGLLEPVVERHHWYVDTANGADSNTGLQPDEAWQSAAKINDEAQNLGILSTVDGFDHGDILVIDTRTKPLELGPDSLAIPTDGITIQPPAGQRYVNIKAEKTISPGAWQKTAGYDAIFQTPDTETAIVLWENDKWMHHPTGNKFEEVAAKLQATAGSFWTDGATLYVHTFDHSNPRTNQKIYSRSRFRGSGDSAILMSGNSWSVHGLRV